MKLKYWLYLIWLSIRWIPQINLGDEVRYRGKKYIIANGVREKSWRLAGLDNGDEGWVPRCDCKKVRSLSNAWTSFKSGYSFYRGYWYDIWVNGGIEPWMKALPIWPGSNKARGEGA